MKISQSAIRRPVFTTMVVLIAVLLGIISLMRLPIDLMPDITYPTLSIFAAYGNAGPEEMEQLVTRPIEEALTAVPGVVEVSSISSEGASQVRLSFEWGVDINEASNDVRERLDQALSQLPEEMDRPTLRKFDPAAFPILIFGVSSDLDPVELKRLVDDQVKSRIERLPGVAAVAVHGGLDREIHVDLDADKIKALGLSLDQILTKIKAENVNLPAGVLDMGRLEVLVRTPGEYTSLRDLGETVIAIRDGAAIQLKEIGTVIDSWERTTRIVRVNGQAGVRLGINKQSGTNTVDVAERVLKAIEDIDLEFPQIDITPIIDTSSYISRAITNVGSALLYGGLLAIVILLVFLRNIRSTLIIATAIPTSILATFALMYFSGLTVNIMSLGGLALGVGMLVDSAIVVLENIFRLSSTQDPMSAADNGSQEVTAAIIASTLTTLAVFLPMVFITGMSGVMFKQMAFVVGFSLICALAVALTLVPMLCAKLLRRSSSKSKTATASASAGFMLQIESSYKTVLHFCLRHRILTGALAVALLGGSLMLIPVVGVEFMPQSDESEVRVNGDMAVGTQLGLVGETFKSVEAIVKEQVPETVSWVTFIGGSRWRGYSSHTGEMRIALTPANQRNRSSEQIAQALRPKLSQIPGMRIRTRAGQGLFLLRMGSGDSDRIELEIRGHDIETADRLAQQLEKIVTDVPGITDVRISRDSGAPEELVLIDRQKAADMKLSVSQIAGSLQTILSGSTASYFREAGDEIKIKVKIHNADSMDLNTLLNLTIANSDGQPIVMRNVVKTVTRTGPVSIERKDQQRIVTLNADFSGRDLGSMLEDIQNQIKRVPIPEDFSVEFGGDYEEQQDAFRELMVGLILALVLVYMVMASLYESLRDPLIVMFSVPFAAIGVIFMLLLSGTTFNVQSYIGCIMLGGIVVNNAILIVDHINLLRRRDNMPLYEAIEEAGRRRIRPILMTALTTMLALVPLALGLGEGAEAQAPMARAVVGGLLSSTIITLVFVPVVYSLFYSFKSEKK